MALVTLPRAAAFNWAPLSRAAVRDELGLGDGVAFKLWYAATRYLVPIAILIIFWSVL